MQACIVQEKNKRERGREGEREREMRNYRVNEKIKILSFEFIPNFMLHMY
jgi:hypothetical protein